MKSMNSFVVSALVVLLGASLTWSGETPAPQAPHPVVKEDVAKLLDDRYIGGSVCFLWPTPSETTLRASEIEANLRTEAVSWLRKAVLDKFVPSRLSEAFIGVRRRLPPRTGNIEMDYLFARYAAVGMSVEFRGHNTYGIPGTHGIPVEFRGHNTYLPPPPIRIKYCVPGTSELPRNFRGGEVRATGYSEHPELGIISRVVVMALGKMFREAWEKAN
jgi:hypothetical protein